MEAPDPKLSAAELKREIVASLEKSGVIDAMRSELRKGVFEAMQSETKTEARQLTNRQLLISSVVHEWLLHNGYIT